MGRLESHLERPRALIRGFRALRDALARRLNTSLGPPGRRLGSLPAALLILGWTLRAAIGF
jgi:hypothetical protein